MEEFIHEKSEKNLEEFFSIPNNNYNSITTSSQLFDDTNELIELYTNHEEGS